MQRHEWHETDGEERHSWRADHHGGRWKFSQKPPGEDHWQAIKEPTKDHWLGLREVLWRKYQRNRISYSLIKKIDRLLGDDAP